MVRCCNCNTVFDAVENDAGDLGPDSFELSSSDLDSDPDSRPSDTKPTELELPFEVPDNLPVLEPSGHAALDVQETLHPTEPKGTPWWQGLLILLLLVLLGLQLAWFNRVQLLQLPQTNPLCQWLDCSVVHPRDPTAFEVISRQLQADPTVPGALRLQLRYRNTAERSQPLPQLQLALFDNAGSTLARRTFLPHEYLFPAPAEDRLAAPQEVFTIELMFEDPGARASGFKIDFL